MIKKLLSKSSLLLLALSLQALPVYAQTQDWGNCVVDGVPTLKCLEPVFNNLIAVSSGLIILALFIMLVIGGFLYLTSLGNPERIKKAQGTLKFALIGFILYMSAFLILKIISAVFLGGSNMLFHFQIGAPPTP